MFKARIKETGEIAEFSTGKNLHGETILLKVGTASFFKPEEVENIDQIGWHPASELPPEEGEYIAIDNGMPDVFRVDYLKPFGWCVEIMGAHEVVNVKYWCYPPKE